MQSHGILIVSSDQEARTQLAADLTTPGLSCSSVPSIDEALFSARRTHPALVLIDSHLPGFQLNQPSINQLKTAFNLPLVFLHPAHNPPGKELQAANPPYTFLALPLPATDLLCIVRIVLYASQLEQQNRKLAEHYYHFTEHAPDMIFQLQLVPEMKLIYINPAVKRITGFAQQDFYIDVTLIINQVHPDDWHIAQGILQQLDRLSIPQAPFTLRWIGRDGNIRWLETHLMAMVDDNGQCTGVEGLTRDITVHMEARHAIQQSEANLRALVSNVDGMMVLRDLDLRAVIYNKAWEDNVFRLFGVQAKPGLNTIDLLPPEKKQHWLNIWQRVLRGERYQEQFEWPIDGQTHHYMIWLNPIWQDEQIVGLADYTLDITHQIETSEALRKHAEQFQAIINTTPDGFVILDKRGHFQFVNPPYCEIVGYSETELLQMSIFDIEAKESREENLRHLRAVAQNSSDRFETMHRHKDGHIIDIEVSTTYIPGQQLFLAFFRDITQRKTAQSALAESELRFRQLTENMKEVFWLRDINHTKTLYASPNYSQLWGISPEEIDQDPIQVVHPEDAERVLAARKAMITQQSDFDQTFRVIHPDGTIHWLHARVYPVRNAEHQMVRVAGVAEDITDQIRVQEEHQVIQERFTKAFHTSPDAMIISSMEDGTYLYVNEGFLTLTGFSNEEVIGKSSVELNIWLDSAQRDTWLMEVMKTGELTNYEIAFRMKNGDLRECLFTSKIIEDNGIPCILAIAHDITSWKQAERERQALQERFTTAFHTSPDSININRLQDGLYLDVNEGFLSMTGYTRKEVIGRTSAEINIWGDMNDRARLVAGLKQSGEVNNLEAQFRIKDGTYKTCLMSARVITIDDQLCILSITRDITDRKHAEEMLNQATNELANAYEETLEGWAAALELREHETAGHSHRVVELTLQLASQLGIPDEALIHIQRGALLHDIGKMGIPDSILLKPGPLSEDEWVVMKQHPIYAYHLIRKIDYLKPSLDIPYAHHERWDGSGYPRGLAGEDIPLAARIFAVVDVWDALCSNRPYRPAWTREAVVSYLRKNSGVQFDPQVVEAFLAIIELQDDVEAL